MSGFIATVSWRWTFWLGLIIVGASGPFVIFYPETYGPVLLHRRAKMLRKETGNNSIVAPMDLIPHDLRATLTVTLTRPLRMIAKEYMVSLCCLYLSLAYAIFYLYFQAYPLIFQGAANHILHSTQHMTRKVYTDISSYRSLRYEPGYCGPNLSTK
jgi:MFS family permease